MDFHLTFFIWNLELNLADLSTHLACPVRTKLTKQSINETDKE